jgi:integrase
MGKRGNGEGSIYQDARGLWRATVSLEGGNRKYLSGRTRQDVAKKLAAAIRDVDHGLPLPGLRLTLDTYLSDWLTNTIKPGRRAGTHLLYETAVRLHITPAIGKSALAKVGPQHVQKLQAELLAKGLGVKRIKLIRAALSAALAQAVRWNLIIRNPVPLVEPPHEEEEEPRPLTPDQATALLAVARGHEFEQLYTVMLATGLRISEALGLRWFDADRAELGGVDLESKQLHVRQQITIIPGQPWCLTPPKSKSGKRTVPLIPVAIVAIQAQRKRTLEYRLRCPVDWPEHSLVFCDGLGQPIVGRRVERVFGQHLKRAGLWVSPTRCRTCNRSWHSKPDTRCARPKALETNFTPHSLRHSCGTWLTAQRVPDRVVMAILGHSSPDMTAKYQHVMLSMVGDAADQLAAIFPGAATVL